MITYGRWMAICFGLAAWFWCTAGAYAQERPASPQPEEAGRAAVVVPSDIHWDAIEWVERRYKIEAIRFKARDETGTDWPGSDEVKVETRDAKGWTVSNEIDNIDSGDTHDFDQVDQAKSCIVSVRPGVVVLGKSSICDEAGEPAPLWFEVEMWEKDWSLPGLDFCNVLGPQAGRHAGDSCGHDGGDDFIGRALLYFPAGETEATLPNVGDEFIETVVLNYCFGSGDVCGLGWGPWDVGDYSFTYRTTRLPDVRVDLRSVLDEAMRRSGARSEIEAIVAGLRSLRAPSPRKIERETANPPAER